MIINYSLKLLKIYEDICQFVKNKNKAYELNTKNKNFIMSKKEEIQNVRKIGNAKIVRKFIDEQINININKIVNKYNTPVNRIKNRIGYNYKIDEQLLNKSKAIKKEKGKEKGIDQFKQNELCELSFY